MCHGFESHTRQLIFLRKVTALGVLCCFALLFVCFFHPSFSALIKTCIYACCITYRNEEHTTSGAKGNEEHTTSGAKGRGQCQSVKQPKVQPISYNIITTSSVFISRWPTPVSHGMVISVLLTVSTELVFLKPEVKG